MVGADAPGPSASEHGGVVAPPVPVEYAMPVWRILRDQLARHRANGAQIPPGLARWLDELRAAALAQAITPSGHPSPQLPDIGADCDHISTDRLAGLLDVTDRHARRLMTEAGHRQVRRGVWRAQDAAALVASRRSPHVRARTASPGPD
ncbi:hypothetical protein HTZ77_18575 [Nonomuraea sp. SMC257]|uniref:Uncharacterized protein n=1 Tax=Nonomuraea montanisoli TaxID=2741721 RepID=A0A7Y6I809_9ACTN|nr:hypothetical protein [Nonomuraea montanisoli]NUW33420.1 hypothetical protein [Nonomuraea montanisoli]